MPNLLFSTYSQGENRVTSTLLAVLENVNNQLAEDVLEALADESDLALVSFDSQVTGVESVPDAAIRGSTALWFETKTSHGAVRRDQLEAHLKALDEDPADLQRLLIITPDERQPDTLDSVDDERVVWATFDTLVDTIETILDRDVGSAEASMSVPTEREVFLLRELVRFLYDEELVSGRDDRVLVDAARKAWPEYQRYGLYFCQPNRSFKPVSHIAFYTDGDSGSLPVAVLPDELDLLEVEAVHELGKDVEVVISADGHDRNVGLIKATEPFFEGSVGFEESIFPIDDVPRNEDAVYVSVDCFLDGRTPRRLSGELFPA